MRFFNETPEERISKYNDLQAKTFQAVKVPTADISNGANFSDTIAGFLSGLQSTTRLRTNPVEKVADAIEETKEEPTKSAESAASMPTVLSLAKNQNPFNTIIENRTKTPVTPTPMMGSFLEQAKHAIGGIESTNNYSAHRWDTGKNRTRGSGAWGRYQFIGSIHGKDIKKVTGLGLSEFLKSPEAQDKFFEWHLEKNVMPTVRKIKEQVPNHGLTDLELAAAVHYRGPKALQDFKQGNTNIKGLEGNETNPSIDGQIAKLRKFIRENPLV